MKIKEKSILIILICYFCLLLSLSLIRHYNFQTEWSLGENERIIFNSIQGQLFFFDIESVNHLNYHTNFILILVFPIYYLFSSTILFMIIKSLVFTIITLFIYLICRRDFSKRTSLTFSILFLLSANFILVDDFHPIIIASVCISMIFYALKTNQIKIYFFGLILLLLTKENMVLTGLFLGIYLFIIQKKQLGFKTITISIIFFLFIMLFFPAPYESFIIERYHDFKTSNFFPELINNLNFYYAIGILLPFLFLPFFHPISIIGIPVFLQNLLSNSIFQHCVLKYYSSILIVIFFLASINFFIKIRTKNQTLFKIMFTLFIVSQILFNIFSYGLMFKENQYEIGLLRDCIMETKYRSGSHLLLLSQLKNNSKTALALNNIPKDSKILTQDIFYPHFSQYKEVGNIDQELFSKEPNYYDWIILEKHYILSNQIFKINYVNLFEKTLNLNYNIIIYQSNNEN